MEVSGINRRENVTDGVEKDMGFFVPRGFREVQQKWRKTIKVATG